MDEVPFLWTDALVERLRELVEAGGTAAGIAEALGCSRGAVIGKVHRLGLSLAVPRGGAGSAIGREKRTGVRRPPAAKAKAPALPKAEPKPAPPPAPKVDSTEKGWPKPAGPEAVDINGLISRNQCRMPLFVGTSGLYCGKPVSAEGSSWCAACRHLVFEARPIRAREDAEASAQRLVRQASRSGAFA